MTKTWRLWALILLFFWGLLFDHRSNRRIPPNASWFIDFHIFRKLFDPGHTAVDYQWDTCPLNSFSRSF